MERRTGTVGLMADPGLPMRIAETCASDIEDDLSGDREVSWKVKVSQQRLPLNADGDVPLFRHAERLRESNGWDYLVYLTDLPRITTEIMLCDVSADSQAAMISLPSVGAFGMDAKTRKLVTVLVSSAQTNTYDYPSEPAIQEIMGRRRVRRDAAPDDDDIVRVFLPGLWNRAALLTGMIRSNSPGRLLPAMSNSIALAAATGAFGIFYGSIWNMSDALHPVRLFLISVAVTTVLGLWLIGRNGLWARGHNPTPRWQTWLDNASTIVTIGSGVVLSYLLLLAVLFVLGLTVIEDGYLESQLGHPVSLIDYLHLSWLSASLGTLAGALGSNFNSEESIREATYSRRVYERRKLADSFEEQDE